MRGHPGPACTRPGGGAPPTPRPRWPGGPSPARAGTARPPSAGAGTARRPARTSQEPGEGPFGAHPRGCRAAVHATGLAGVRARPVQAARGQLPGLQGGRAGPRPGRVPVPDLPRVPRRHHQPGPAGRHARRGAPRAAGHPHRHRRRAGRGRHRPAQRRPGRPGADDAHRGGGHRRGRLAPVLPAPRRPAAGRAARPGRGRCQGRRRVRGRPALGPPRHRPGLPVGRGAAGV